MWIDPKTDWTPDDAIMAADINRMEGNTYIAYDSYVVGGRMDDPTYQGPSSNNTYDAGTIFLIAAGQIYLPLGYRLVRARHQCVNLSNAKPSHHEYVLHTRIMDIDEHEYYWNTSPYSRQFTGAPLRTDNSLLSARDNIIVLTVTKTLGGATFDVAEIARADDMEMCCGVYVGVRATEGATQEDIAVRNYSASVYLWTEPI
jgi:hypothetical protein